ncbi:MAG: phosphoenolpyruvate carboxylase, partial [Anaerolineae bacterium]|nr:phosphoenolpyruvate carboxylase [Anaerolineae bacterium]
MSVPSLPDQNLMNALSGDIRLLGNLLGRVIREQHGEEAFNLVEEVRLTAKARRGGNDEATARLITLISGLDQDAQRILVKAFTLYFQLINIAEDQQRIRVLRQREAADTEPVSIRRAVLALQQTGIDAPAMRELLNKVRVRLVMTAHPTESKRKEVLVKLRHIAGMIERRDRRNLLSREQAALETALLEVIEGMWQTRISRASVATVADEVDYGLYFLTNTIMDVTGDIYLQLEQALRESYPDEDWSDLPAILSFASWVGGDRDGNPNVTPAVTLETLDALRRAAQQRYLHDLAFLGEHLTQSQDEVAVSPALNAALMDHDTLARRFPGEVYRQLMTVIRQRLSEDAYQTGADLLSDLQLVEQSLLQNRGRYVAKGMLGSLMGRIRLFGLHLVPLEIREDARRHAAALDEIFRAYGTCENYLALSEQERQALLTREIANSRPLFPLIPRFS